jgi:polyisoprenoid-binding protein YceI
MVRAVFRSLMAMSILASGVLLAAELNVGPATKGTVVATFKQEGVAVDSPFTRFKGMISYDPKNVGASTALIEVETASLDIGDPAYNAEVARKSWFDSATYPTGEFRSTAIKPLAANRFEATGTLTIKGRTQTISVPVSVATTADGFVFDGSFAISRKAFGIGAATWDGVLEDQVVVKFHLVGGR